MSASAEQRIGEIVDRYRIEALLGEGGFGAVYRAKHVVMGRDVALKLLHPGSDRDDDLRERFLREAQAAASVGHHAIVQVFDCGITQDGMAFIAMEMLQGEDLEEHLKMHGRLPRERAVRLVVNLLDALEAAHNAGIVHRDLKPANVFLLRGTDDIKVLDFGISQMRGEGIRNLTRTGMVMGTPHYMAPETFRGVANVDARADLYAVGAILYELFAGATPHDAQSYEQLVVRVATMPAPPILQAVPDLPAGLARIVDHALTANPDDRWPDARSLRDALMPFAGPSFDATHRDDPSTGGPPVSMTPAWGIGATSFETAPMPAADPLGATGVATSSTPAGYLATPSVPPPARAEPGGVNKGVALLLGALAAVLVCGGAFIALQDGDDQAEHSQEIPPAIPAPLPPQTPTPTTPTTPTTTTQAELLPDKEEESTPALTEGLPSDPRTGAQGPPPLAPPPSAPTIDEVRIELVSALSSARGPALAFGDSAAPHVRRCARGQAHVVRVMLMVGSGGRISIAQPDPNEEHGDDVVAACVANRMAAQGPIPEGTNGILVYRVELPPS